MEIAEGDVNGDGVTDKIIGAGKWGGPRAQVRSGINDQVLSDIFVFDPALRTGINLAAGDANGDGFADILVGPKEGGGPHVKLFSGKDGSILFQTFVFEEGFLGGVNVALGDLDGNGRAELILSAGVGGGPRVKVLADSTWETIHDFFAFDPELRTGIQAVGGDTQTGGDGVAEIFVSPMAGGSPLIQRFETSSSSCVLVGQFFAFNPDSRDGAEIGITDFNGDGEDELLVVKPGGLNEGAVLVFKGSTQVQEYKPGVISPGTSISSRSQYLPDISGVASPYKVLAEVAANFGRLILEFGANPPANSFQNLTLVTQAELQPGDILVAIADNSYTSGVIRLGTWSAFSHSALYLGNGEIIESVAAGVRKSTLAALQAEESRIGVIRYPGLTFSQAAQVISEGSKLIGSDYNFPGIVLMAFDKLGILANPTFFPLRILFLNFPSR
ncbi:MAG: hypothetical protein EXR99_00425 [Gemmataceae bacterium]|nr:hypothetical protein [Gemmataceae bacterium]